VLFETKLQCNEQIVYSKRLKAALNTIKLIKRYFTFKELLQLLTSNCFAIFYYKLIIWHLQNLNSRLNWLVMSISAGAIRLCMSYPNPSLSHVKIAKRATPDNFLMYKLLILLYKLFNNKQLLDEWCSLKYQQVTTLRRVNFKVI
jgi:hypothetical protein